MVINMIQRILSKVCAMRFVPVVEHLYHPYQSTSLKGRRIHDGILALS